MIMTIEAMAIGQILIMIANDKITMSTIMTKTRVITNDDHEDNEYK